MGLALDPKPNFVRYLEFSSIHYAIKENMHIRRLGLGKGNYWNLSNLSKRLYMMPVSIFVSRLGITDMVNKIKIYDLIK